MTAKTASSGNRTSRQCSATEADQLSSEWAYYKKLRNKLKRTIQRAKAKSKNIAKRYEKFHLDWVEKLDAFYAKMYANQTIAEKDYWALIGEDE